MMRVLLTGAFFVPFVLAVLLACRFGSEMPTHVLTAIALAVATVAISYLTRRPDGLSLSSRIELPFALAQLWYVLNAFIRSTTIFAYPIGLADGTTAWCHNGTMTVAMTWTFFCFFSAMSVPLDAAVIRFAGSRDRGITSLSLCP